jgi:hypothetical protein
VYGRDTGRGGARRYRVQRVKRRSIAGEYVKCLLCRRHGYSAASGPHLGAHRAAPIVHARSGVAYVKAPAASERSHTGHGGASSWVVADWDSSFSDIASSRMGQENLRLWQRLVNGDSGTAADVRDSGP